MIVSIGCLAWLELNWNEEDIGFSHTCDRFCISIVFDPTITILIASTTMTHGGYFLRRFSRDTDIICKLTSFHLEKIILEVLQGCLNWWIYITFSTWLSCISDMKYSMNCVQEWAESQWPPLASILEMEATFILSLSKTFNKWSLIVTF
jgi:hypothetical protein